jgi:hypothetical protein
MGWSRIPFLMHITSNRPQKYLLTFNNFKFLHLRSLKRKLWIFILNRNLFKKMSTQRGGNSHEMSKKMMRIFTQHTNDTNNCHCHHFHFRHVSILAKKFYIKMKSIIWCVILFFCCFVSMRRTRRQKFHMWDDKFLILNVYEEIYAVTYYEVPPFI